MLLTVSPAGFQLGGGTESDATLHDAILADQRRPDAGARRPSVRVRRQLRAAGGRCRMANVRSPGSSRSTARTTGLGLADFLLGRLGVERAGRRRRRTRSTWRRPTRPVRAGHLARGLARDDRTTACGGSRSSRSSCVNGAVYQFDMARFQAGTKSTVFPNGAGGPLFPRRSRLPDQGGHADAMGTTSGRAWAWPGIRRATARRRCARRTASRTSS